MTTKLLFLVAVVFAMSGCTELDQMTGRGVVRQGTSGFDNATVIEASPNNLSDPEGTWTDPFEIGARWSSAAPDSVALVVTWFSPVYGDRTPYKDVRAFFINIDGAVSSYSPGQPVGPPPGAGNGMASPNRLYGINEVVIPYATLQRMVAAKDCRIRIQTSGGYKDFDFTREHMIGGKPAAILAIKEMMAKVAAVRANG